MGGKKAAVCPGSSSDKKGTVWRWWHAQWPRWRLEGKNSGPRKQFPKEAVGTVKRLMIYKGVEQVSILGPTGAYLSSSEKESTNIEREKTREKTEVLD